MKHFPIPSLPFALAILVAGCQSAEPVEVAKVDGPLQGKTLPKLVGTWDLTAGAKSTITLNADGTSRIVAETPSPGGTMKSDVAGTWIEDAGKLSMRRKGPNGDFTVVYLYTLDSAEKVLTLTPEGRKAKLVFRKLAKK